MSSLRELLRRLPRSTAAIQSFLYGCGDELYGSRASYPTAAFSAHARHRGAGDQQGWYPRRNTSAYRGGGPSGSVYRQPSLRHIHLWTCSHGATCGLPSVYLRPRVYVLAHSMCRRRAAVPGVEYAPHGRAHKESTIY